MEISFEQLCYSAEAVGLEYESYSGRAMYGEKCFGIVCDNVINAVISLAADLVASSHDNNPAKDVDSIAEDVSEFLSGARTDSMGRQQVVYWPKIKWQEIPH